MKNTILFSFLFLFIISLASCGSSPYKKRKGCNGHGGWYGHRNLSKVDVKKNDSKQYVWNIKETNQADF